MDILIPFYIADFMGKPAWVLLTFVGIVIALLAFDLGVLHKNDKLIGVRESLLLSAGYISVAVTFGLIAGGVLVSMWKTRGQPAVVEAT